MVAQDIVSLLFLALVGIACAFDLNSIREGDNAVLTCMVPKPDGTSELEPRRRVGLEPGEPGTVWLPKESGFARPNRELLDELVLMTFLSGSVRPDIEFDFITNQQPSRPGEAPLAAFRIPVEGSGGDLMRFVADPRPTIPPGFLDPDMMSAVNSFINTFGLGDCEVTAEWIELPDTYFPRFFAGSKCMNLTGTTTCSFPPGLQCHPDISTPDRMAYVNVLRWDCCWSFESRQWIWRCGWRNVEIPIIVDCVCGCGPNFP